MKPQTVKMLCPSCTNTATCTVTNHGLRYPEDWTEISVWTQDPLHKAKVIKRQVFICSACYARLENGDELKPTAEFHERVLQYKEFIRECMWEYLKGE